MIRYESPDTCKSTSKLDLATALAQELKRYFPSDKTKIAHSRANDLDHMWTVLMCGQQKPSSRTAAILDMAGFIVQQCLMAKDSGNKA
jgi:hypothetical protein